jgi:small-conductance mechanosensitive channel
MQQLRTIIQESASQLDESVDGMPPDVVVTGIGADAIELKVVAWIRSISSESSLKSELLQQLVGRFRDTGIRLL